MIISPDEIVWQVGGWVLNATIVYTWVVMLLLVAGSMFVTRKLSTGVELSRAQNLLEVLVGAIRDQVESIGGDHSEAYFPFVATIFIFVASANLLNVIPGYMAPTGSLSTTAALAICVFVAVPLFGIGREGLAHYLRQYVRPTVLMLPFNVIGELSRTIALAIRLYGNIMSGTVIVAILLSLTPFFFPLVMQLLGLLTGMIQAYIFAVLATVYIASASTAHAKREAVE